MTAPDDAQIMQRVQRGEYGWFDVLVQRYEQPLRKMAFSKLGNVATADDVVQEAFLAAFAAKHTYKPEFSFRTWLWTILLNLCRKQYRQTKSREPLTGAVSPDAEPASYETGLQHVLRAERREQVEDMLSSLPEPQADALRLRFYGGLKFQEIAEAMQCSLSGAKRRVQAGLARLAELIRETDCLIDDDARPSPRGDSSPRTSR